MIDCIDTAQISYFLSLLDPSSWVQTAQGILITTADVLWSWNEATEQWCM